MKRVRGIALLVALIIVALATAIAGAIAFDTGLGLRRAQGGFAQDQALQLAGGAEAIAAQILVDELASGTAPIHDAQRWRSPIGPFRADIAYGEDVSAVRLHVSVGVNF